MDKMFKFRLELQAMLATGLVCAVMLFVSIGVNAFFGPGIALFIGCGVGLAGLGFTYILASRIAVPLRKLTAAARDIGRDPMVTIMPWLDGPAELTDLSSSLRSLVRQTGGIDNDARFFDDHGVGEMVDSGQIGHATGHASDLDPLTGLLKGGAFLTLAEDAIPYFQRYGRTIAIMMINIDGFKSFNDVLGRKGGDAVIGHVADVLSLSVRVTDKISRFAGQDFVILLREIDKEAALMLAERMRAAVKSLPLKAGERAMPVSVSIGVATVTQFDRDIQALIERADQALQIAKQTGGNCVKFSHPAIVNTTPKLERAA